MVIRFRIKVKKPGGNAGLFSACLITARFWNPAGRQALQDDGALFDDGKGNGHGNGHDNGHDNGNGHGHGHGNGNSHDDARPWTETFQGDDS